MLELPTLPYSYTALEPYISRKNLRRHHEGNQAGYVRRVNELIAGVPELHEANIGQLLQFAARTDWEELGDQVAQVWNHSFLWHSMAPGGGGLPKDPELLQFFNASFGGWDAFRDLWVEAAADVFGSGWVWLLVGDDGAMDVGTTPDAGIPARRLLLNMDVWEHAYICDRYGIDRRKYAEAFADHLLNWQFALENLGRGV